MFDLDKESDWVPGEEYDHQLPRRLGFTEPDRLGPAGLGKQWL